MKSRNSSPYYPPRARFYSPILGWSAALGRQTRLDRLEMPHGVSLWEFLGGFFVPGFGFWLRQPRFWGRVAIGVSAFLLIVFFVFLGQGAGNVAYGLLISIHSSGLVFLLEPWFAGRRILYRIVVSCVAMGILSVALYVPARHYLEAHWLLPLQIKGKPVVVQRIAGLHPRRGELVAYSLAGEYENHIVLQEGFGIRPVLGVPGDTVQFSAEGAMVNGKLYPSKPHMPRTGETVVSPGHYFIWPEFQIGGHGAVSEQDLSGTLLNIALVSETQIIGKPFRRWFLRNQVTE
jgi:hypothetical protein